MFPKVGIFSKEYPFSEVDGGVIFSVYKANANSAWRKFIKLNIEDFAKAYWYSMKLDAEQSKSRKRKLSTFIKSIYDQKDMDVALIMIKAISYLIDKETPEGDIIETIVKSVLPSAGFSKSLVFGRYVWGKDDRKKFKSIIGKAFVLNYINNNFDKDAVWKFVKKYCFMKDGVWNYKNSKSKKILRTSILSYLKTGGIIVEEKLNKEFTAWIPLAVMNKAITNGAGRFCKETAEGNPTLSGVASNTSVDRDEERVASTFIKKMQKTAVGLPIFINSHYPNSVDETIGVIKETGGDDNTFEISGVMEKPDDNELVKKVMNKMELGIGYGFSVGGRVTKAFREFDEDLQKEVIVLADGDLHHVLLTNQPANADTFAEAVAKSVREETSKRENLDKIYEYKHSSRLAKDEVSSESVVTNELPDTAFPINHRSQEVSKDYAHHFIKESCLYLHKGLLVKQYKKAIADKAPEYVVSHLRTHLQVIGLGKQVEELNNMIENMETLDETTNLMNSLVTELTPLFKAVGSVKNLDSDIDSKKSMLKNVLEDVSTKIVNILESVEIED